MKLKRERNDGFKSRKVFMILFFKIEEIRSNLKLKFRKSSFVIQGQILAGERAQEGLQDGKKRQLETRALKRNE